MRVNGLTEQLLTAVHVVAVIIVAANVTATLSEYLFLRLQEPGLNC